MRKLALLAAAAAVLATLPLAPVAAAGAQGARTRVIVTLDADVAAPGAVAADLARRHNGRTGFVYRHALKGFSMELPAGAVAALSRDGRVMRVEPDATAHTFAEQQPTGVQRIFADDNAAIGIDDADGATVDVDVAILDTGIDSDHPDLNVVGGTDCASGSRFSRSCVGTAGEDGNGHGTHVAGTVAARDDDQGVVGVAPGARLHAVRVLNDKGSGQISWIIAGIDWVTARAAEIEVANMSLGCECSVSAMDTAIANSVAQGVTYAVSAGNSDKDTATFSPANHPDVITVSALADFDGAPGGGAVATCRSDVDDTLADFSNFGSTVEIAAPGVCIRSTWLGGGYHTISGTSMSSPHVAGAAALLASTRRTATKSDADAIRSTLLGEGNFDWTDDSGDGIKEPLLDVADPLVFAPATVGGGDGGTGPSNIQPTAGFTSVCDGLTCGFTDTSSDGDGTVTSWSWSFGDGTGSTAANPSHTFAAGGSYSVTLTVTDDDGATDDEIQTVTVTATSSEGITLAATGYKIKGVQHADLTWSGAGATAVVVYRDNDPVATNVANDGAYTDVINRKGGGSYTYRVCEAGTSTCSNDAIVTF